ncbi:MAG: SDR family oxidoreductase [Acidobacteriales bacterium]|nr:SDR family oxidoreductase [Terriglobales bacterium]
MALLNRKVAVITGAATGIGESIARTFANEGARVVVFDRDGTGAKEVAADIRANGGAAVACRGDVRDAGEAGAAIERALSDFGRLDILVNNAGIYPRHSLLEMTEAQWDEILSTNLKGVFQCTRLSLPHMVAQGSGKIVNISSVTFHIGMKDLTHYVSSKGGIIGFTRALAREVGGSNIHVNAVTPGAIETEAEKKVATQEQVDAVVALQCLRRRIVPLDVARVCVFLASELSDGMTGQTVNVDGGWVMY